MSDLTDYQKALSEALESRRNWLEKSVMSKLKENLRSFQTAYTSLYSLLLQKGLIKEDPYKNEAQAGEICVPETTPFSESDRIQQLSIRLSNYDNQLDFLANFYQFNVDFFSLDRIKGILGLIKYVDWGHLSPSSKSFNTVAVSDLINSLKGGESAVAISRFTLRLFRFTKIIIGDLKILADFNRELYKKELREVLSGSVPEGKSPSMTEIKKKFVAAKRGKPFYTELAEEMLKEDYSAEGHALREGVLKALKIPEEKPKAVKKEVSIKSPLVEGIQALGSISSTLNEIGLKFDENEILLENRKTSFWVKLKRLLAQLLNKEEKPTIYELEYTDELGGGGTVKVKEKVNFTNLREDIDKKVKNLAAAGSKSAEKIEALPDEQLTGFLERVIKDIRTMHRTLNAMDEYFKAMADQADRNRVRGIKPELATIKNAFLKANEKYVEYSRLKEEEEQFKRMGIHSAG
jgi:hypothetical protein